MGWGKLAYLARIARRTCRRCHCINLSAPRTLAAALWPTWYQGAIGGKSFDPRPLSGNSLLALGNVPVCLGQMSRMLKLLDHRRPSRSVAHGLSCTEGCQAQIIVPPATRPVALLYLGSNPGQ